uniref:ATPase SWSAP1-like n=1 Tax=Saccoglossus kowalevskii TaxID=10224 RepID=A0ABM0MTI9_SACKO|nr:PREDICTED: ATPase SWSAP1-like [Saccoglossus kowalevskii]
MAVVLTYMFPHLCDNFPRLQTACESTKSKRDIFGIHLPEEASKCLLVGENGSGKSSLLFQCALSYASEGNKVVYITHSKLQTMPLQVHGTSRPDAMLMKQVQLLYLVDREALLDYLSSIHTIALPPHVIIVDDLDYYCKPSQVRYRV